MTQRVSFEWVLEESRVDFWRTAATDATGRPLALHRTEQRIVHGLLRGLALLLVIVVAAASAGMSAGERERREAQKGITFTLALEAAAWAQRDRGLYESLIDPYLGDEWEEAWRDYWRAGEDAEPNFSATVIYVRQADGLMQATVITEQPAFEWWQSNPYREERFYRRVDQRWLRTVPPPVYWGEARELHTEHLHFIYYERDAEAVEQAAPKLEKAFVGMYRALGLIDIPAQKQVVSIVPQPIGRWSSTVPQLHVTSPILAQIPADQSEADYLAYDVMNWFTYRAVRDAAPNAGVRYLYRWPILVWGLRGWLRDDLLDQASPWHADALKVLRASAPKFLPITLDHITDLRTNARPTREEVILRYLSAESFMRFVVANYGQEHLPDLMRALVRYGSWDDIIPVVYGRSVADFETAWNMHLRKEYGLDE